MLLPAASSGDRGKGRRGPGRFAGDVRGHARSRVSAGPASEQLDTPPLLLGASCPTSTPRRPAARRPARSGSRIGRGVSSPSHDRHATPRLPDPRARRRADPCLGRSPGTARQPARAGHRGRPGRGRGAGRCAQAALDQEGVEDVGARARDLDDGPDHPRGEGHAGQDPGDVRQGDAPAAGRPDDPVGRRRVRLSGARRRGEGRAPRLDRQGRQRRDRLPVGPDVPRHQGRRGPRGGRGRRRRGRHGHRPRRLPVGRLPDRLRGDRRGQGGGRRGAPQGHPRDRRARDLRQRPARDRSWPWPPAPTSSRPRPAR